LKFFGLVRAGAIAGHHRRPQANGRVLNGCLRRWWWHFHPGSALVGDHRLRV